MKAHIIAVALLLALASSTFLERKKNKRKIRQQILCCNDEVKGWEEYPFQRLPDIADKICSSKIIDKSNSRYPDIYHIYDYDPEKPLSGACCIEVDKDRNSCDFRFGNQKKASKRRRARRMRRRRA